MSNAVYISLGRQAGLAQELSMVANNLANSSTTGYKTDRAIFSEYIQASGNEDPSISMGWLSAHTYELSQGAVQATGNTYDLALQGDGFFAVETDRGVRLTRAGHFQQDPAGRLTDAQGNTVLGAGGNQITIPDNASLITIGADGSISADGQLIDRVGVFETEGDLVRDADTLFEPLAGYAPFEAGQMIQGALEQSNVSPVEEIARMIAVQRAYEAGQSMMEREDQRITQLITTLRNNT